MMKFIHLNLFAFVVCCSFQASFLSAQSTCEIPCSRNECGAVNYDVTPLDSIVCEGSIVRFKNNTTIQSYTGLVIRWGDGKQDTVYQLNDFYHKYDLPESLKAACQNDTILHLTVCITAFKQCNEGFSCSQKVQSFPIKIALKPKASFIASTSTACVGARVNFQNTSCFSKGAYYSWRYSTFRITNIKDINLDYDLPGQYEVVLTAGNSCGADSLKQIITILQKPKASVLIDTQSFCFPVLVRLKNNQSNTSDGVWKIVGDTSVWEQVNTFASGDSSWIRFKRLGAIDIKLITSNGCGTDSVTVPFVLKSTPFFKTDSEVNFCQEGFVSPESLLFTYDKQRINTLVWKINNENPLTVQGASFQPAYFKKNGTINLQTTGQCGTFNHVIRIQVFPKDTLKLSNKNISFCTNAAPIQLSASPTGSWSGFGISASGLLDPTLFVNKKKSTVYFDASNAYCTLRDSVLLSISEAVTVALAPVPSLCENEEYSPVYAVNGLFTDVKWRINGGTPAFFSGLDIGKIKFNKPGQYGVKLEATNLCGTTFDTTTINVLAKPVLQQLNVSTICLGEESKVNLLLSNPENERLNVAFYLSGKLVLDTLISGNSLNWIFRPLENIGNYPLKAVVSKALNCSSELLSQLRIMQKPTLSLPTPTAFCSNNDYLPTFNANGSFESIRWSFPGGTPSGFAGANPGKITYRLTGKYTVKVEGISSCGSSSDSIILDIIEQPAITRFTSTPVCLGRSTNINLKWSNLSGNAVRVQLFQSENTFLDTVVNGDVLNYSYFPRNVTGNFPLTMVTTAGSICKDQAGTNLNVYTSPPVSITNLKSFLCIKSNTLELIGSPTGGVFSGIDVVDLLNGRYHLPVGNGVKERWIYYHYTDNGGCKGNDSFLIKELKQAPVLAFENLLSDYCKGNNWIDFKVKPSGGSVKAVNGLTMESVNKETGSFRFRPSTSGVFTFSYLYSDPAGCSDTLNVKVNISDTFPFDPGRDTLIYSGQKLRIGKPPVEGYSYRWFDGSTQSTLLVEDPGIYTVEVFHSKSGCSIIDTIKVSFGGVNNARNPLIATDLMEVFPNPFEHLIFIKRKFVDSAFGKGARLHISDVYGNNITSFEWSFSKDEMMLDLSSLPSGIYFIHGIGKPRRIVKI